MRFMPIGELLKLRKSLVEQLGGTPEYARIFDPAILREFIAEIDIEIMERTAGEPEAAEDSG